jgi:hypothetical protein
LNARISPLGASPCSEATSLSTADGAPSVTERRGAVLALVQPAAAVDPVADALETALALRKAGADQKALRRALRAAQEALDEA